MITVKTKLKRWVLIVFITAIFCLYTTIHEIWINDPLFDKSNTFVEDLQTDSKAWKTFFLVISYTMTPAVLIAILLIIFIVFSIQKQIIHLFCWLSLQFYILSVLKLFFNHPRPYMVDDNIMALDSSAEFGDPSGHSSSVVVTVGYFYYILFHEVQPHESPDEKNSPLSAARTNHVNGNANGQRDIPLYICTNRILEVIFAILGIAYILLIMLSRIYLGVHSINQVILGAIFGLCFLLAIVTFAKTHEDDFFELDKFWIIPLLVAASAGLMVLAYYAFRWGDGHNPDEWKWRAAIIAKATTNTRKMLSEKCLTDCGIISVTLGFAIGFLIIGKEPCSLLLRYLNIRKAEHKGKCIFSSLLTLVPAILLVAWGQIDGLALPNVYVDWIVRNFLATCVGLILFSVLPYYVLTKLGWMPVPTREPAAIGDHPYGP